MWCVIFTSSLRKLNMKLHALLKFFFSENDFKWIPLVIKETRLFGIGSKRHTARIQDFQILYFANFMNNWPYYNKLNAFPCFSSLLRLSSCAIKYLVMPQIFLSRSESRYILRSQCHKGTSLSLQEKSTRSVTYQLIPDQIPSHYTIQNNQTMLSEKGAYYFCSLFTKRQTFGHDQIESIGRRQIKCC